MAVAAYDSHFGITQDALARGGTSNRGVVKRMSKEEQERFMRSPAMLKQAVQEEAVAAKTSKRDKRRTETDGSFKPQDSDWEQAPSFKFDRRVDYYRTLGVDEFECLEGVKRAYRRLSLVYHPDKTRGLDLRTSEEYKRIFIELHNAYLVLSDNPTRRQYDRARDDQAIAEEVYGKIGKKIPQFDAFVELEKIARRKTKPAKTVDVVLKVKLEKMFYGGIKRHRRARKREEFDAFVTETVPYELVVPPLCQDGYCIMRKHTGDHHKDAQPDHLNFKLQTKEHPLVKREDEDLLLRRTLKLHKSAIEEPYTSMEISALGGRTLLLFGRNPFYGADKPATSRLHVAVLGEGFGREGRLRFSVEFPSDHRAVEPAKPGSQPACSPSRQMVIMVKHRDSGGECCVTVPLEASFGDVLEQMVQVLGLPGITAESFTLHKRLVYSDGLGPKLSPTAKVGTFNEIFCMGTNWVSASLSPSRSNEFVSKMCEAVGAAEDAFLKRPPPATVLESVGDVSGAEPPMEVRLLLPYFGFPPSASGLHNALQVASLYCPDGAEELGARLHALAVGQAGGAFTPPPRRTEPLHPLLRQRSLRAQGHPLECRTELVPLGALDLVTVPSSRLDFYSNVGQSAAVGEEEGSVRPRPLYAVVLSCPRGAHKAARKAWAELRRATMYLLVHTLWILVRPARSLIPRSLTPAPHTAKSFVLRLGLGPEGGWPEASPEVARRVREVADELEVRFEDMPLYPRRPPPWVDCGLRPPRAPSEDGKAHEPHTPWDRLGTEALGRGDPWTAYACWSAQVVAEQGSKANVAAALVRRAECLQCAGDEHGALADARTAAQLQPSRSEAHRRVGELCSRLGFSSEARTALVRAVELDPRNRSGLELLQRLQRSKGDVHARGEKKDGNSNVKGRPAKAVALYTLALSAASDEALRAELHANRSAALARIGAWELAREDAMSALALRSEWQRGRLRLATALLALGRVEEAYAHFRIAELALPTGAQETHPARRGREACLSLLPLWRSPACSARLARFWRDNSRRRGCTRVFALSDVHFDHPGADDWISRVSGTKFQEDVLIVAGNVGESLAVVRNCLRHLRFKFRRVFFVPGNHDLWVHSSEEKEVPDSFAKLFRLLRLCDEIDVDIFPAAVCEGVFVVPLFSWYNADFDEEDPYPSSEIDFDKSAKWPIDKANHLPRYMLYLNRHFLEMPYTGTVLTFSHFLPRAELPYWNHVQGLIKAVGCPQLDPQLRQVNSSVHVFGHSHRQCDRVIEGVRYVQCPLGYQSEHAVNEPIRCIFDGSAGGLTSKPVPIED